MRQGGACDGSKASHTANRCEELQLGAEHLLAMRMVPGIVPQNELHRRLWTSNRLA